MSLARPSRASSSVASGFTLREYVPLASLSTFGVGGAARWFTRIKDAADLADVLIWAEARGTPVFVLGGGSNLIVADEGFDGLVVHVGITGVDYEPAGADTLVTAGAGESWDPLVAACVARELAGVECLSGIPGTVGGTPIQNVGAYGQDVARTIESVDVYDRRTHASRTITADRCGFAYRSSRFKGEDAGRFVVCAVRFRLRTGSPTVGYPDVRAELEQAGATSPTLRQVREAVIAVRRRKGMVLDPADVDTHSVGSFFMNPVIAVDHHARLSAAAGVDAPRFGAGDGRVKVPAAWLIEHAGFRRGYADGAVGISNKHTLALINRGGATARDVLRLALTIKRGVADRFGVLLRPEPNFVGFDANAALDELRTTETTH
jgi:UDP-N-acetylmuramate dehydrogenase